MSTRPAPEDSPPAAAAWADPAPGRPVPLLAAAAADLRAHVPPEERGAGRARRLFRHLWIAATSPGFHLALNYRVSHAIRHRLGPPGRLLSLVPFWFGRHFYGCTIAPTARLHGGLILPHPQGIVVGAGAEVGPRAWIFQNVTLGGAPGRAGLPRVGADARIYAGAVLAGPIAVGDNVVIGANAVVHRDVPPRSIVRSPAPEVAPMPDRLLAGPPPPPPPVSP